MKKYIDITVPVTAGMVVYKGDPPVEFSPASSTKSGDPYNLTALKLSTHSGTHIDAPHHFFSSGKTIDQIPLDTLIGPVRVVLMRGMKSITTDALQKADLEGVTRVFFKTDHSYLLDRYSKFRTDYVHLEVEACGYLVARGMKMVGIDSFSVEKHDSVNYMSHKVLLGAGVVIVEMLNLKGTLPGDYNLYCLPLNLQGTDGAPVRAVLGPLDE